MKNIILIIFALLITSCNSQEKDSIIKKNKKIRFYPNDLVFIDSLPRVEEINNLEVNETLSHKRIHKKSFLNAYKYEGTRVRWFSKTIS